MSTNEQRCRLRSKLSAAKHDNLPLDKVYLQKGTQQLERQVAELQAKTRSNAFNKKEAIKAFNNANTNGTMDYNSLSELRKCHAMAINAENNQKLELKDKRIVLRSMKFRLQELSKKNKKAAQNKENSTDKKTEIPTTKATLESYKCEDNTEMISITKLKSEADNAKRPLVFAGTDPGLCTLSTTARLTMERYEYHIKLYNPFNPLQGNGCEDDCIDMNLNDHFLEVDEDTAMEPDATIRDVVQQRDSLSVPVLLTGAAGTGFGSRLKGHLKRGGSRIKADHHQHALLGMTNEYRSSQTCVGCYGPIMRQKASRASSKGERSVNGASLCMNIECPPYRAGQATQNRDIQAAMCIALAGASLLLTGETLHPFTRYSATIRKLTRIFASHTGTSEASAEGADICHTTSD
ncbi:hypothetical protein DFQ29_010183 [Apophysomyces sp. BC1021]|nr:hypothetical protein DFQ29_010183 [Apophysomyces sp. BC1021]